MNVSRPSPTMVVCCLGCILLWGLCGPLAAEQLSMPDAARAATSPALRLDPFPRPADVAMRPDPVASVVGRAEFWIDLYKGEIVPYSDLLSDLETVHIIYLGERHTLDRHHAWQARIVADLAARGYAGSLGMEQLEVPFQPIIDRYNRNEIDLVQLARATDWARRWQNFQDYLPVVAAAHQSGGSIFGLNARAELVKEVAREGLGGVAPDLHLQIPPRMPDPQGWHRRLVMQRIQVHAGMKPSMQNNIYDAQTVRDETMAATTAKAWRTLSRRPEKKPILVVVCGSAHCSHGLGIPQRVRHRLPDIRDRILHFTESGDLKLSPRMQAMARKVNITHEQLRFLNTPIADYLHAIEPAP